MTRTSVPNERRKIAIVSCSNRLAVAGGYLERRVSGPSETDASSSAVRASGARVFTWKTDGKVGTHEISLKSSRGASATAVETFSMTLNVLASDADND